MFRGISVIIIIIIVQNNDFFLFVNFLYIFVFNLKENSTKFKMFYEKKKEKKKGKKEKHSNEKMCLYGNYLLSWWLVWMSWGILRFKNKDNSIDSHLKY